MLTEVPRSNPRKRKGKKREKKTAGKQAIEISPPVYLWRNNVWDKKARIGKHGQKQTNKQTNRKENHVVFFGRCKFCQKQRHDEDDDQITLWQDRNAYPPQTDTILPIHVSSEIDGSTSHDTYPNLSFAIVVTYQVVVFLNFLILFFYK
jgi:hypothetical protein